MRKRNIAIIGWLVVIAIISIVWVINSLLGQVTNLTTSKTNLKNTGYNILIANEDVCALAIQHQTLWAGGKDGLFKIDTQKHTSEKIEFEKNITYIKALCLDNDQKLWIGYQKGLIAYDTNSMKCTYFTTENGIADNRVNCISIDRKGLLWVGTWGGASIFDGHDWRTITKDTGLASNMVNVITHDGYGNTWFGAYTIKDAAISIKNKTSWQYFSIQNGLPNNNITSITQESNDKMWVGTGFYDKGGACRLVYQNDAWKIDQLLQKKDGLAGEKVRSIFKDSLGNIWFGSEYDGGSIMKDNKFKLINQNIGLSNDELKFFTQDDANNLWIGTREGITEIPYSSLEKLF